MCVCLLPAGDCTGVRVCAGMCALMCVCACFSSAGMHACVHECVQVGRWALGQVGARGMGWWASVLAYAHVCMRACLPKRMCACMRVCLHAFVLS